MLECNVGRLYDKDTKKFKTLLFLKGNNEDNKILVVELN